MRRSRHSEPLCTKIADAYLATARCEFGAGVLTTTSALRGLLTHVDAATAGPGTGRSPLRWATAPGRLRRSTTTSHSVPRASGTSSTNDFEYPAREDDGRPLLLSGAVLRDDAAALCLGRSAWLPGQVLQLRLAGRFTSDHVSWPHVVGVRAEQYSTRKGYQVCRLSDVSGRRRRQTSPSRRLPGSFSPNPNVFTAPLRLSLSAGRDGPGIVCLSFVKL